MAPLTCYWYPYMGMRYYMIIDQAGRPWDTLHISHIRIWCKRHVVDFYPMWSEDGPISYGNQGMSRWIAENEEQARRIVRQNADAGLHPITEGFEYETIQRNAWRFVSPLEGKDNITIVMDEIDAKGGQLEAEAT